MIWSSLTPQERAVICEHIHRRLTAHLPHTAVGLMHACGQPIEIIDAALADMLKRKAVVKTAGHGKTAREMWAAVLRST